MDGQLKWGSKDVLIHTVTHLMLHGCCVIFQSKVVLNMFLSVFSSLQGWKDDISASLLHGKTLNQVVVVIVQ